MNSEQMKTEMPINFITDFLETTNENPRNLKMKFFELNQLSQNFDEMNDYQAATNRVNEHKNRYANILAPDHTRVILSCHGSTANGHDSYSDDNPKMSLGSCDDPSYINANWLTYPAQPFNSSITATTTSHHQQQQLNNGNGNNNNINTNFFTKYICGQYPLKSTVNDFWRMVLEHRIAGIVTLAARQENKRVKGDLYWPTSRSQPLMIPIDNLNDANNNINDDDESSSSYIKVQLEVEESQLEGKLILRRFMVTCKDKTQMTTQMEYLSWADFDVPSSTEMLQLIQLYNRGIHQRLSGDETVYIHCSAGVGRTGVFVTLDTVMKLIKLKINSNDLMGIELLRKIEENLRREQLEEEEEDLVKKVLLDFRSQRPHLVQTPEQYYFIYECLYEWSVKKKD